MSDEVMKMWVVVPNEAKAGQLAKQLRDHLLNLDPTGTITLHRTNPESMDEGTTLMIGMGFACHLVGVGMGVVLEHFWKQTHTPIKVQLPSGRILTFHGAQEEFIGELKQLLGITDDAERGRPLQ
jgi:hypothetical protein